jgi:hypothetical protein
MTAFSDSLVLGRGDFEYVVADRARRSFRGLVGHELNSGLRHLDGHGVDDHVTLLPNGLRMKFTFCKEIGLMAGCLLRRFSTGRWHVRERGLPWPFVRHIYPPGQAGAGFFLERGWGRLKMKKLSGKPTDQKRVACNGTGFPAVATATQSQNLSCTVQNMRR